MRDPNIIPVLFSANFEPENLVSLIKDLRLSKRFACPHVFFNEMPTDKTRYALEGYCYFFYDTKPGETPEYCFSRVRERFQIKPSDVLVQLDGAVEVTEDTIDLQDSTDTCKVITIKTAARTKTLTYINEVLQ